MLEEPYRTRAMPMGGVRYWSWLFASPAQRDPLLGLYALTAELRALMDPGTDPQVARIKLAWWQEELTRLTSGSPLHPITRFLARLPQVDAVDFATLQTTVEATAAHVMGAPLESAADLPSHANSLYGVPLLVATRLADRSTTHRDVRPIVAALAAADYLVHAIAHYVREARIGRVVFAVDELLAAQVEDADLVAATPPPALRVYLGHLRLQAHGYFASCARLLAEMNEPQLRHLMVLTVLGASRLKRGSDPSTAEFRIGDLYKAWNIARRAARGRITSEI